MENDNDLKNQLSDWSSIRESEIAARISPHHHRVRLAGARRCLYPARWGSVDVKRLGRRGRGAITDPEAVKTVLGMNYYTLPNLCGRLVRCIHVQ